MRFGVLKSLLTFLGKPQVSINEELVFSNKISIFLKLYLITILFTSISNYLIWFLIQFGIIDEYSHFVYKLPLLENKDLVYNYLIIALFFMPIIEELCFRLLLTQYNKQFIMISFSLVVGYFASNILNLQIIKSDNMSFNVIISFVYPLILAIPLYAIIYFIKFDFRREWNDHFQYIFYIVTVFFAIAHLPSFDLNFRQYLFMPFIILPLLISGLVLGYIRIRFGIFYSIIFHFLINVPIYIKLLIITPHT